MKTISALRAACAGLLLATTAVPALAQSAPPIEAYGALPAIEQAELSLTGRYTAMLMTVNNQRQVLVLDAGGAPVKQFIVGDEKVRGIDWIGDDAILLQRSETGRTTHRFGNMKREWVRGNVLPLDDSRDIVSIFAKQNFIANTIAGFYGIRHVGGQWLGYFGGYRMGVASGERAQILHYRPALYSVDLFTGKTDQVAFHADDGKFRDWLVDSDGSIVTLDVDSDSGRWSIDNASGDTIVRGEQRSGRINLTGFDASGTAIIYSEYDRSSRQTRYFQVSRAGGTPTEIWEGEEIHRITFGTDARVLGIITTSGDIKMGNAAHEAAIAKVYELYPRSVIDLEDWTGDLSAITFRTSGNYDSGTWYRLDSASGARAMLGLERPYIQGPAIGAISTFEYAAADGLEIDAVLTLPAGREAKGLPVVVLPHGGPNAHDEPEFDWWAQAFAARGYAVLQPNFRGSTDRDEAFQAAGDGEWGGKMLSDIADGLAALAAEGTVDAQRACIVGASYGGYAALAGVTLQNGLYRCAVGVNGVYDLAEFFQDAYTGRTSVYRRGVTNLLGEGADRKALSPRHRAETADAPVMLIHGRDDTVVPYTQSVLMEDALKDAKKPVQLVTLDGEDHWFSQADTRTSMLKAAVAFVEKHNPAD